MPNQTLLVEGKVYSVSRPRSWPSEFGDNGWKFAHSIALICPKCLDRWAVLAFEGDEDIRPEGAYCAKHEGKEKWFWNRPVVAGSILPGYSYDFPLLEALPEELLKRELMLTLKRMENEDGISAAD